MKKMTLRHDDAILAFAARRHAKTFAPEIYREMPRSARDEQGLFLVITDCHYRRISQTAEMTGRVDRLFPVILYQDIHHGAFFTRFHIGKALP